MSDKTDEELRREYQRLLNELDRAPPEKPGFVPVADPHATISHLQQSLRECEAQRDAALAREREGRRILKGLYDDQVDYLTINHLGGLDNHYMKQAREYLAPSALPTAVEPDEAARCETFSKTCGGSRKVWRESQGDAICVPCLGCEDCAARQAQKTDKGSGG